MFSGIVEETGKIVSVSDSGDGRRLRIAARTVLESTKIGDSIAVSGCCLTAVELSSGAFLADASHETLKKTKLGKLKIGDRVNLERAIRLSDRLGGHLVSGHIDGLAKLVGITDEGFSKIMEFEADERFAPYFIEKGSVAVDGISLTVASLTDSAQAVRFAVAVIPHTLSVTTLSDLSPGDTVNLETDLIGKYVARWLSGGVEKINKEGVSMSFLQEHGYT